MSGFRSVATSRAILLPLIGVPVLGWAALAAGMPTPAKGALERRASAALGRSVAIGGRLQIILKPWGVDLIAHDVRVGNPVWARDLALLRVKKFSVQQSLLDMLTGRSGFEAASLSDGTVSLERAADGRTSWPGRARDELVDLSLARVISADRIRVTYRDARAGSAADLAVRGIGPGAVVLTGTAETGGRSFVVAGDVRSGEAGPARLRLAAVGGGDRFGVVARPTRPLGLANARLTFFAAGGDVAALGRLAGLTVAPVGDYAFAGQVARRQGAWRFTHVAGRIGGTDLAGALSVRQRDGRAQIVGRRASETLRLGDGMALLGIRTDASTDPERPPRWLPDAALSAAGLQAFDATLDYSARRVTGFAQAAGPLSLRLAMRRGVLALSPSQLAWSGGFVSSDILIDARRAPVLARYDIRLSPTPMGRLLPGWGVTPAGTTAMARGRLVLTGRGATVLETLANASGRIALVMPAGEVRMQRVSESALDLQNLGAAIFDTGEGDGAAINCGAIAFTVTNGVGTTDPFLIDTPAHVVSGQGSIDLRDERIDLRLAAGSKHFSLFGRPHPVVLGGSFAAPTIAREPVPWLRPATLLGLEFSLPNLRSLFRFVDPGDTEPVACPTN